MMDGFGPRPPRRNNAVRGLVVLPTLLVQRVRYALVKRQDTTTCGIAMSTPSIASCVSIEPEYVDPVDEKRRLLEEANGALSMPLSVSDIEKRQRGIGVKSIRQCQFSPAGVALVILAVYFLMALGIGMHLEKWGFTDTIYFAVSTLITVGYGDVVSNSTPISRISTALFVFIGVCFIGFAFGVLVTTLLDRDDDPFFDDDDDDDYLKNTKQTFCGLDVSGITSRAELSRMRTKFINSSMLVMCVLLFGTLVMGLLEQWPPDKAFYWSCVTVTTVGFGDVVPTRPVSKWFTTFYMVVGTVIVARSVTFIASIPLTLRKLRMQQEVLAQWHDNEALQALAKAEALTRLGLRENARYLSKCEFVLQMLLLTDVTKERDLKHCCRHYDQLADAIKRDKKDREFRIGRVSEDLPA